MKETLFEVKSPLTMSNGIILVLQEENGPRLCYMSVDIFSADSVATELLGFGLKFTRPSTHRLMLNTIEQLGFTLEKITVTELWDNVYRAVLCVKDRAGNISEIDSRPSDAITLALIKKCPMLINDELLKIDKGVSAILKQAEELEKSQDSRPGSKNLEDMTEQEMLDYLNGLEPNKLPKA